MRFREYLDHDDICVFQLEGEIDLHYAPALRALFAAKAKAHCRSLVVDLGEVSFIDSTGISVLLEYLRDASEFDGRFCVARPTEHVRTVFEIVQLRRAFPIFDTVDAALAAIRSEADQPPAQRLFQRQGNNAAAAAAA